MPEFTPVRFGRYELLEHLAVGGMANLYRGRVIGSHGFERDVVIKKILPHLAGDPVFVSMFIDEAKITARLQHPKIVQILELGSIDDELFIAMEYVEGCDVLALLVTAKDRGEPLPTSLAVHIAHEVLDALDYAHDARDERGKALEIVHRDVSPANVMVSWHGDVKLTDFGIARAAERRHETQAGFLKGKYCYMSPEQVMGADLDARSDVFAAGILLAEMLIARRLFAGPNDLEVLLKVRDVKLDRLDEHASLIPKSLRAVLDRALQRVPEDRFPTAGAFRDALGDWLFDNRMRVAPKELAAYVADIDRESSRSAVPDEEQEPTQPREPTLVRAGRERLGTISGPATRYEYERAREAAERGRELFESGDQLTGDTEPMDVPTSFEDHVTGSVLVVDDCIVGDASGLPTISGNLHDHSPFRVMARLARDKARGLLVFEHGRVFKEAYFTDGDPQFVRSNVLGERLGEYLVAREVITRPHLERALELLPHFGGKLGETLVGLRLMKPLDAVKYLTDQVRDKLVDVCNWGTGTYSWHALEPNPYPYTPLHLDTFDILGRGSAVLPAEFAETWAEVVAHKVPVRKAHPPVRIEAFRIGLRAHWVYDRVDDSRNVRDLVNSLSLSSRVDFLRTLYLFTEAEVIDWATQRG